MNVVRPLAPEAAAVADLPGPIHRDWTGHGIYALAFLTLISTFNYFDRSILGLVLPLIKAEMQVSDTMLGLVSGLAFALFYSALGVPIAWAADRYSRRNIIALGLAFWSLMTAMTGFVVNIWQLALTRFLMGAGEAACLAPSQSMIADLFSPARRPMAIAIFGLASGISSLVLFPVAGWVSELYGWRAAFLAAGAPGLLLAIFFWLTVREPARGASDAAVRAPSSASLPATLRGILRARTYLFCLVGVSLMGANAYAASAWSPTFLERVHDMSIGEIANIIGPVRGLLSMAGVLLGGFATDWFGRRDPRWRMYAPGILCLLVCPAEAMFLFGDADAVWIAGLAATSLFTLAHQAPIYAAAMAVVPVGMRATAIAVIVLCASLIGQIIGPLLVGWLNDVLAPVYGDVAIRYSMTVLILFPFGAGLFFLLGARSYEADTMRAAATAETGSTPKGIAP